MSVSMERIIKAVLFTPVTEGGNRITGRWGLPLLFVGSPGSAKTTIIRDIAESWGLATEILSPGERGEGAFGVVPVPQDGVLTYPMPEWELKFERVVDGRIDPAGEAGLVFVDELNTGGPSLQAPLLGLVNDGRIGGGKLPNRVRRLGAMNAEEDAANGFDLAPALCNRFGRVEWVSPGPTAFAQYWLTGSGVASAYGNGDAATEEARVLAAWPEVWARTVATVTTFVQRMPDWVTADEDRRKTNQKVFASRRTVALAMHALAASEVHGLSVEERNVLVDGFVGEAWRRSYFAFISSLSVPLPEDVLDGKVRFEHDVARLDMTYLVLAGCTAHITSLTDPKLQQRRGEALWSLLASTLADAADIAQLAADILARRGIATNHKHAIKVMASMEGFEEKLRKI